MCVCVHVCVPVPAVTPLASGSITWVGGVYKVKESSV